jgi:hypothetical protein
MIARIFEICNSNCQIVITMKPSSPKKSMQNVSFDSVEDVLEFIPADEVKITQFLRKLVFECVPDVEEYLSFNVLYYRRNAGLFFIWPGSVSWGKSTQAGVRFGFQSGYLLRDELGYLDRGGRKQIFWRDFLALEDVDVEVVRAYLFEAVEVDDRKPRRKR